MEKVAALLFHPIVKDQGEIQCTVNVRKREQWQFVDVVGCGQIHGDLARVIILYISHNNSPFVFLIYIYSSAATSEYGAVILGGHAVSTF